MYQKDNVVDSCNINELQLPQVVITDKPRFEYRGVLLDVARHYQSVNTIKTLINAMAAQKINTLHIHFSDDEGFRIGVLLDDKETAKADNRGYFMNSVLPAQMYQQGNLDISNYDNQEPSLDMKNIIVEEYPAASSDYQKTYSTSEIHTLIKYANDRQITLIPEIDLPGHAKALVDSNPGVFIDPNDKSQYISVQGYYDDVLPVCSYNNSSDKDQQFTKKIDNIIKDIRDLFSDQSTVYFTSEVSLGGDEVSENAWTDDPSCDDEKNLSALEKSHKFFNDVQQHTGVKISGWQQAVQNNATDTKTGGIGKHSMKASQVGHIWVWDSFWQKDDTQGPGLSDSQNLAKNDYPTVIAYSNDTYFDLTYTPQAWEPGFYWATQYSDTHAALNSALDVELTLAGLTKDKASNIKGLEATLWSENINNSNHLWYMAFPKMTGLAEASWSNPDITVSTDNAKSLANYKNDKINWNSLTERLGTNNDRYLGYLNNILNPNHKAQISSYRGYPNGISKELPKS